MRKKSVDEEQKKKRMEGWTINLYQNTASLPPHAPYCYQIRERPANQRPPAASTEQPVGSCRVPRGRPAHENSHRCMLANPTLFTAKDKFIGPDQSAWGLRLVGPFALNDHAGGADKL